MFTTHSRLPFDLWLTHQPLCHCEEERPRTHTGPKRATNSRRAHNIPRQEDGLLVAEVRHVTEYGLGLLTSQCLLEALLALPRQHRTDAVWLTAIWAGGEFHDFPVLEAVMTPILFNYGHVRFQVVGEIEF